MTRRAEETQRNARHNVQVIVFGLESRRPPSLFEAIRVRGVPPPPPRGRGKVFR